MSETLRTRQVPADDAEAALKALREAVLLEALETVLGEQLWEPNPESEGDEAYQRAVLDCANAVRRLAGWPEEESLDATG